jgi:glycosyltransferase involved in cell wall biosynthesis
LRPARILMISGNGPEHACGIAHYTERLLTQLSTDRGDNSFLWLSRRAKLKQRPLAVQAQHIVQVRPWHTWRPASWRLAGGLMRVWRPHIVHIQDEIHSFHETSAAVELARQAKRVGAGVVVTLHEYHTELPSARFTDELVHLSDAIIVQDARNRERCTARTGRVPDAVGWSPSNIDPPPTPVTATPDRVVTFGLISRGKGLEVVHEALKRARLKRPELSWYIMGPFDPAQNDYHRELKQRLNEPWIVFTGGGTKEMEEISFRSTLASAALMLLPFADGCSPRRTTLQAAWSFGLPTITTAPEAPEPGIRDGDNCALMPGSGSSLEQQHEAWASAVVSLLGNATARALLSDGGRAAAKAHSWLKLSEQHEAVYSRWLGSKAEVPP